MKGKTKTKIILLIPVLREQEIINKNLDIFTRLDGDYELVYITTQKEVDEKRKRFKILKSRKKKLLNARNRFYFIEQLVGLMPYSLASSLYLDKEKFNKVVAYWNYIANVYKNSPSTADLITGYLKKNKQRCRHVHQIHYPYVNGLMSHQLNYACEQLSKDHKPQESFILIYNADSAVERDVLDVFLKKIECGEKVIMQSSLFLENYNAFPLNFSGWILKCIALTQSRWTFIHEISRIRAQYKQGVKSLYESAHVVGHGTCVRLDTLLSVGGFPEIFTNEDLPLGYFLALAGERICPVAILENSQSPTTISSVITQYTTWFYGAMDYFYYYRYAVDELYLSKYKAFFWAVVNSVRAAMWLLAPWVWVSLVILPLFLGMLWVSIFAFSVFLFHTAFVYWLIVRFVNRNPKILGVKKIPIIFEYEIILATPVAYLVWGIGPTWAFMQVVVARLSGKKICKKKTER